MDISAKVKSNKDNSYFPYGLIMVVSRNDRNQHIWM